MNAHWRLIISGAADGAWNMALDQALLAKHASGDGAPVLRLYRWSQPTVSLGRFQDAAAVDRGYCAMNGIDVCRRPTGGRGVLHDDELTYSVIAGVRDGLPRGVSASYRLLCGALVEVYRELGIDADLTSRPRGEPGANACYLHVTSADVSLGVAKLSGSAQVWERGSCLQHGSFVFTRDVVREAAVFRLNDAARAALTASTRTISDAVGACPDPEAMVRAVRVGFERAMGISLTQVELDERALKLARAPVDALRL